MVNPFPLVTCVMPTFNRRDFVPHAIKYFQRQEYKNKELLVIDDGEDCIEDLIPKDPNIKFVRLTKKITLGAKLNLGCSTASGSVIVHWDDDDWYASDRISCQVSKLKKDKIEICGINQLVYLDVRSKTGFEYRYPENQPKWLLGSTLCYERKLWIKNNFEDINVGMDGLFVWATPPEKISVLNDSSISVHLIHDQNVSLKKTENERWHSYPLEKIKNTMKEDFEQYVTETDFTFRRRIISYHKEPVIVPKRKKFTNVYACLVHEEIHCVIDMVRNLHFNDPTSSIIILNSCANLELEQSSFPFSEFGAVIYPKIISVSHGYLHNFALSAMQFAVDNFTFDTLTIVDSDQLSLRAGYSSYLAQYFSTQSNVGLLSNRPERVTEKCVDVFTAIQAFKEYELWKPLLKSFPNGEQKFLHWSFWPSTVFTIDAIKDVLQLFNTNKLLKDIMCQTKIWATEEIILPTMVSLLGYDIKKNPCEPDLVDYKRDYTPDQLNKSFDKPTAFWVHPINRCYDDVLRKHIRKVQNEYQNPLVPQLTPADINTHAVLAPIELLAEVRQIEGWLCDAEAEMLMGYALKACQDFPEACIVEVGSYKGKATVLLGRVATSVSTKIKVYSVDMHDGILGSADQGFQHFGSSLNQFKENIKKATLCDVVIPVINKSKNLNWSLPISLLLIDGLHDYLSVCEDFMSFTNYIETGGFVAFHDYVNFYPDVISFVNGLIEKHHYQRLKLTDSLIVIQKVG